MNFIKRYGYLFPSKNVMCIVTYNFRSYFVILLDTNIKIKKGFVTFAMSDFTESSL